MLLKVGNSEILVLLAESKENVCIIIRGESPNALWQRIINNTLSSDQISVDLLSPTDIFANTKTFPLVLDAIPSMSPDLLNMLDHSSNQFILHGKSGEVQCHPAYPWSFLDKITLNIHPKFEDVHFLELKPPQHGKTWENPHYQQEFELVSSAFKFFLGVDCMRTFKLEKIVLLHNPKLEGKFKQTEYHEDEEPTKKSWQQAIMTKVRNG